MKATNLATLVLARLATIPGIDVMDGVIIKTPQRPYVAFYAGIPTHAGQRYGDVTRRTSWTYSVLVVNNSAQGARLLADRVTDVLDDHAREPHSPDGLYSISDYSSALIVDDEIEGLWRYSITCHFIARTEEDI